MFSFKKELILLFLILAPVAYAVYIWGYLPGSTAAQFNTAGLAEGLSEKGLIYLIPAINLLAYLSLLAVSFKVENKDSFYNIRLIQTFLFTAGAAIFMRTTLNVINFSSPSILFRLLATSFLLTFAIIGYALIGIKRNNYIGIRTDWTLNNDFVWDETHKIGGKLFLYGGLTCFIVSIFLPITVAIVFIAAFVFGAVSFSVYYSYWLDKKLKEEGTGPHNN